ncbi:MAG: hypothetical protein FWC39_08145 [Bacteroidetes bacterium]|nr:hypothetical protein [Bacteroidota bacterium]
MKKILSKTLIISFLCAFATTIAFAQDDLKIFGQISIYDEGESVVGTTIRVIERYATIQKIELDEYGTYELYLPYGKNYMIIFEKHGYTKIQIAAQLKLPKEAKQGGYRPLELSFHMFKPEEEHGDLFKGVFHTIQHSQKMNGFFYDVDVDYMVQQRIVNDKIFKQKLNDARKGSEIQNDSILDEKKYLALINQGTEFYNQNQFYAARKFFIEAAKIRPERQYTSYKLVDIKTELEHFEVKAELLGIDLDSLISKELRSIQPKNIDNIYYPAFVPLTDEQVDEIFKRDLRKQIIASSANAAEANRTLALMNDLFNENYKNIASNEMPQKREPLPQIPKQAPDFAKPQKAVQEKPVQIAQITEPAPQPEPAPIPDPVAKMQQIAQQPPTPKPQPAKPQPADKKPPMVINFSTYQDSLRLRYPETRTIEVTQEPQRKITRVILNNGSMVEIFRMVEHTWGATYYFIEEYPSGAQSIGYAAFMNRTKLHETQ